MIQAPAQTIQDLEKELQKLQARQDERSRDLEEASEKFADQSLDYGDIVRELRAEQMKLAGLEDAGMAGQEHLALIRRARGRVLSLDLQRKEKQPHYDKAEQALSQAQAAYDKSASDTREVYNKLVDLRSHAGAVAVLRAFETLLDKIEANRDVNKLQGPPWWEFAALTRLDGEAWAKLCDPDEYELKIRRERLHALLRQLS